MPAGNNQRHCGQNSFEEGCALGALGFVIKQHGVDVPFEVIHPDQGLRERSRQRLAVNHADQKRAQEAWAFGHGDAVNPLPSQRRALAGFAYHWHDPFQVLARGEFRHHAAVFLVHAHLRGDDVRKNPLAVFDHGGRRLVAARFDAEDSHIRSWAMLA